MRYKCKYNPSMDIQKAVPDLALDLQAAIETGIVVDGGTVVDHNEIDSPNSIRGRIADAFDAIEEHRAARAFLASAKSAKPSEPSQPSGEGAQD